MKIKILLLIPSLDNGGAEKCLVNMVNNLNPEKYDITVMTLYDRGENRKYLNKRISYSYVFKKYPKGFIHLYKLLSPKILYKKFVKGKFDIIVSYLEGPTTRIVSGCCDKHTKLINWIHCDIKNEKRFCKPYRNKKEMLKIYSKYYQTIFVSKATQENFINKFPSIFNNSKVIHNIVDTDEIIRLSNEKIKMKKKGLTLVSVGRLAKVKGFDRLFKIINKLIHERIECFLWIIGNGSEEKKLKKYIDENKLNNYISLLGYDENPYKYVKNADIYVCSSYSEAYSTSVTEAVVLGKPIITTLCSGMNEILDDGKSGLIVENNENALYDGLKKIIIDDNFRRGLIELSKIKSEDLSLLNQVKCIEDFFENVIK